jgi:predicted nucleotidyltransferase
LIYKLLWAIGFISDEIFYKRVCIFDKMSSKMLSNLIVSKIAKTIHDNDPLAEAYLFGSRARGDSKPNSDWDILILVNDTKVTNEIEDKFRDDLYDIELDSGQVISTFIYPKDYWQNTLIYSPLYDNVKKEGIRL